jgi:hypothetical protein
MWHGGVLTNVSQWQGFDGNPRWSAEGDLLFDSDRGGNRSTYRWRDGVVTLYTATSGDSDPYRHRWPVQGPRTAFVEADDLYLREHGSTRRLTFTPYIRENYVTWMP